MIKRRSAQRAFTLVELIVGIAMFGLLAVAIQSAMLLATRAIPDAKGPNFNTLAASAAIDRLYSELACALSVTEMSPTAVTFTVADRDASGADETIRYAWSGVAGAALTRQYNGAAAVSVLDDVRAFALAYDKRSVLSPAAYTEQPEQLLFNASGLVGSDFVVTSSAWVGETFTPSFPGSAVRWRITRVKFKATEESSDDGVIRVQVRTTSVGNLPSNTVVDQATFNESVLSSSYTWQEVSFARPATMTPGDPACVVFRFLRNDEACAIQKQTLSLGGVLSGATFVQTSNGGTSWTANALLVVPMQVYGAYSTRDADQYQYFLTNVRATLRAGSDSRAALTGGGRVLAEPQVTGP